MEIEYTALQKALIIKRFVLESSVQTHVCFSLFPKESYTNTSHREHHNSEKIYRHKKPVHFYFNKGFKEFKYIISS